MNESVEPTLEPVMLELVRKVQHELLGGGRRSDVFVAETREETQERIDALPSRWESLNLDTYMGSPHDLVLEAARNRQQLDHHQFARGLTSKFVLTTSTVNDDRFRELQVQNCRAGEMARVRPSLPHRLLVIDREVAVLGRPGGEIGGVFVSNPDLIEAFVATFFHFWDGARPFRDHESTLRVRDAVSELLFDGLTDDAIARRLSIGSRTVSRAVAGLMTEYDCQTRFQLGAALARVGSAAA